MTPFHRAREAAKRLRKDLFKEAAASAIRSDVLIHAVANEDAEDFTIEAVNPADRMLGGADALLIRKLRQIIVRNDASIEEQAFLIAHEFGHWKLHPEDHDSCHKVIDSSLNPEDGDTLGALKVEAYGARERAELQANIFARELLLPREVARSLFLAGKTAKQIRAELDLPLELVRQQLLDGLLLPEPHLEDEKPKEPITPTAEQSMAATSKDKVSLVVAGPGTGKTTTLLMRVQYLLLQGVKPSELLLLTFSNRAARELIDRLQALGIEDAHDIWVGTFHAFGLEFLRKNHEQFNLRSKFGVADKMAQIAVIEPHIHGLELTAFNPLGDPLDFLNEVVKTIQRAKDELADVDTFAAAVETSAPETDSSVLAKQRDIAKLYQCYEAKLRAEGNLVDIGDLVMLPAMALTRSFARFNVSVGRFKHILVDEYQDVNRASAQLVKALADHADSLWVVGDARQAIYRFRGASMRNIVRFGDDFPKHKTFPLNENRRSYEEVIRVFEHAGKDSNPLQMVLPLDNVMPVRGASGVKPRHIQCANDRIVQGELAANARRLHSLGIAYRDQIVLASTHETCGIAAEALNASGVPALHLGDIFQRSEVKDLLALLQLFTDRSGSGLLRASHLQGLEIPLEDVDRLLGWLKSNRPTALMWLGSPPTVLSDAGVSAVKRWAHVFNGLTSTTSPWEVACELLLERTNILRPYLCGENILDITRRIALWQFIYYLRVPEGGSAYQTVGSFLTRLRRRLRVGDDKELRIPPPEADSLDAVAVMTIHGSKGLEFEAVHLVDIDAKNFSAFAETDLVPKSLVRSMIPKDNFEAESEASNKLYVALSRAKHHLILYEKQEGSRAACAVGVAQAAHLLERIQGTVALCDVPTPPSPVSTRVEPRTLDLSAFLSYRVCPRRYYYDFIKELSPATSLHPSVLIEGAVMRELFAPYGVAADAPPGEVDRVLETLGAEFPESLPYLQTYAVQLLTEGRVWLGAPRAQMAKPFVCHCAGLPLHVAPHRITKSNSVVTLEFVRTRPAGKLKRQHSVLRWLLKHLTAANPNLSYAASIFVLCTGVAESISPDSRSYNNQFIVSSADGLLSGDFSPRRNQYECPKCRHFMYCPA